MRTRKIRGHTNLNQRVTEHRIQNWKIRITTTSKRNFYGSNKNITSNKDYKQEDKRTSIKELEK